MADFELGSVVSDDGFLRELPCIRFGDNLVIFDIQNKATLYENEGSYLDKLKISYGKSFEFIEDNYGQPFNFNSNTPVPVVEENLFDDGDDIPPDINPNDLF